MMFLAVGCYSIVASAATATPELRAEEHHAEIKIRIVHIGSDAWSLTYKLAKPADRLDLGPSLGGFRQRDWQVITDGVKIKTKNGRDYLEAEKKPAKFSNVVIRFTARTLGRKKDYEPIVPFGQSGGLLYTGHFWPWRENGGRQFATFSFVPEQGAYVSVFDQHQEQIESWQSSISHPAFVYFGPLAPTKSDVILSVTDPEIPAWVSDQMTEAMPKILSKLAMLFGRELLVTPNLFFSFQQPTPVGWFGYAGDALPGQFRLALSGGGWLSPSELGADLLNRALAHEAVHLWQLSAFPRDENVPDWIHEGAADGIAAEALLALGIWDGAQWINDFDDAKEECAFELDDGSLRGAIGRGSIRGIYACGHVLMRVAAQAHNDRGSISVFWRDFADRAEANDGYDAALFFSMIEEAGGRDLARKVRRFERTAFARPDREIDHLLGLVTEEASRARHPRGSN